MSGQNRKIENGNKKSSGHTPSHSNPFFSYKGTLEFNGPEIKCNPRPGQIGQVHPSMKTENK